MPVRISTEEAKALRNENATLEYVVEKQKQEIEELKSQLKNQEELEESGKKWEYVATNLRREMEDMRQYMMTDGRSRGYSDYYGRRGGRTYTRDDMEEMERHYRKIIVELEATPTIMVEEVVVHILEMIWRRWKDIIEK